ncbi:sigma-70 family RNA polymerase sigma factor [Nonomuraea terrae]|uniref:Sigma-70 family RNA polymerase sigma factor n=1 Tax=Nonomuraea terrae TaxID=2530383 RepID=A0A4R4Y248_9ACTN|nr:sigma-70 family RNA polymerase sigma factor [Nonomuraea terrae]TDD37504.1 sigma-70 family RNA polymerase sigma factor [Nonomuraea terrae]
MSDEREPTAAELLAWRHDDVFLPEAEATPEEFPYLRNISAGFLFGGVVRPLEPAPPEYVTLRMSYPRDLEFTGAVGRWNMLWEAAQFRRRFFDLNDLPEPMAKIADLGDVNVTFVPRTRTRHFEYAPLFHLLPKRVLEMFGLPLLRGGQWPFIADWVDIDEFLPRDFEAQLARAWAWTVWPHLMSGSKMKAFSADDPIRLLAHNLDFWVPAVTVAIQDRLRDFPEVDKGKTPGPVTLEDGSLLSGAVAGNPRMGGPVWFGEDDARDALVETVEAADQTGRLRGILEAVRSHRVEDDFSSHWSYAREDFERKLHGKRRKITVKFVELTDTTPVQGPESEVLGNLVTNDFLALLDARNREIVVLLNSGVTKKTEIAHILGYANHSAVSKRLVQIRQAAEDYFDEI